VLSASSDHLKQATYSPFDCRHSTTEQTRTSTGVFENISNFLLIFSLYNATLLRAPTAFNALTEGEEPRRTVTVLHIPHSVARKQS